MKHISLGMFFLLLNDNMILQKICILNFRSANVKLVTICQMLYKISKKYTNTNVNQIQKRINISTERKVFSGGF